MKFKVEKYLKTALFIYDKISYRFFIAILVNFGIGILDGLGLSLFLPLLELIARNGESLEGASSLGGMSKVLSVFLFFGLKLEITTVLLFIIIFFILKGILFFIREYIYVLYRSRFIEKIRLNSINGIVELGYEGFLQTPKDKIINTLNGETERINRAYTAYFDTLKSLMLLLVYLSLAFIANPEFSIIIVLGGLLTNILFRKIYTMTKRVSKKITVDMHSYQGLTIEFIETFKYLKATRFHRRFSLNLEKKVKDIEISNKRIGYYNSILASVREPMNILIVCVIIYIQVTLLNGAMGGIVLALLFFYRGLNYLLNIQTYWNRFLNMSGSLENYFDFEKELKVGRAVNMGTRGLYDSADIVVENLSFNYLKGSDVLSNLSFTIKANSIVGIVGPSGSGKSTLINLLLGLFREYNGSINYKGINIKDLSEETLCSSIGYVSQDPVIFNASVFDNITLWASPSKTNINRFNEICIDLGLDEVVNNLASGSDTIIESGGGSLSGGQKQKISIARELFKSPNLLVLDEATASLDSLSENDVKNILEQLSGKHTIVVVAHRMSTIRNADEIYLLDKGRLVDRGSFEELYKSSGLFKNLVELQSM